MLCFIALFVFLVLSIFSAKYRPLAKRAIDCVIKKMTLRPCESGLDEEIKAKSIAGIMKVSPGAAGFVNRHFEAISFAFTLLFFLSIIFSALAFIEKDTTVITLFSILFVEFIYVSLQRLKTNAAIKQYLKYTVKSNQSSCIFCVPLRQFVPNNNHSNTACNADQYQTNHIFRITVQKYDCQ